MSIPRVFLIPSVGTRHLTLAVLGVLALTLGGGVGVASAAEEPEPRAFLGTLPVPANGVAFDQKNGTVLVTTGDSQHSVDEVQMFPPGGGAAVAVLNGGETPQGSFRFESRSGLAVDGAGDIYVSDGEHRVVDKFEPKGPNASEGYKYLCQYSGPGRGCIKDPGVELGTEPTFGSGGVLGLAVDQAGDLYAADKNNSQVDEFNAAGGDVAQITGRNRPSDVAVDASMNVFLLEVEYPPRAIKLRLGVFGEILSEAPFALAAVDGIVFDADSGSLLLAQSKRVTEYDPASGKIVSEFPTSAALGIGGNLIATQETVGSPTGNVYIVDENSGDAVDVYGAPPPLRPMVQGESVVAVTSSSVQLRAVVEPELRSTHYVFQFGNDQSYGGGEVPLAPGGVVPGKQASALVSVQLEGLAAGATYHYRVVASNKDGATYGPDQTFTTFQAGGGGLPDGRVWEMVSPLDKNGGPIEAMAGEVVQASPDGERVTFRSGAAFGGAQGNSVNNQYLAGRGQDGWSTQNIFPSFATGAYVLTQGAFKAFSTDLSRAILYKSEQQAGGSVGPPLPGTGAPAGYRNAYLRDNETSAYQALLTSAPSAPASEFDLHLEGVTPDLSHLVVREGNVVKGEEGLSEWSSGGGRTPVNVPVKPLIAGETVPGAILGSGFLNYFGEHKTRQDAVHAVSADGSRVFWSVRGEQGQGNPVFVREGGVRTVALPAGEFVDASTTGSRVLLSTGEVYDVEGERRLGDVTGGAGGFVGEAGASEDLSTIYFVDTAVVLGAGANSLGQLPRAGENNLYLYREGGSPTFIDTLAAGVNPQEPWSSSDSGDWARGLVDRTTRVTSDGTRVVFVSSQNLTSYDSAGYSEVYLYDAVTGGLVCVSCNPTGERPVGGSTIPAGNSTAKAFFTPQAYYQSRVLSADGSRVFFDSPEALVAQDTNGAQDVYEWENGRARLISSGTGAGASFVDASESGGDVFFTTANELVAGDTDQLVDLYDARAGGGFPVPATPPACTGTGCQGVPAPPPIFATPSSVTFNGIGNFPASAAAPAAKQKSKSRPARCKKGFVKKHNKCVKAKTKKQAKKSSRDRRTNS